MAENPDNNRLRRKRRKLGGGGGGAAAEEENYGGQNIPASPPAYNFLHLVFLILEHDLAIIFPGSERPRNAHALVGAGGSFLVFKEPRTMADSIIQPAQIRSLEDGIVLKRTRQHDERNRLQLDPSSSRYLSIMSELQILLDPAVQAHNNIIDLHGLTWDFEPEDDGSYSVWPVLGLEAAECSMQNLMCEYNETEAPLSTRLGYCYNVAVALEFLHSRGVAHCDVKLENVLVCVTQRSGSVGKLSDFGSALLGVDQNIIVPKGVAGSPPWNAPEYRRHLRGLDILKLDVFSFGMLLWRFISRSPTLERLESASTEERGKIIQDLEELKMSDGLLRLAAKEIKDSYEPSDELDSVIDVLQKALAPLAEQRCSMAEVCSVLAGAVVSASESDFEINNVAEPHGHSPKLLIEDVLNDEQTNCDDDDDDDDDDWSLRPILPISFELFYNDLEKFYEVFEDDSPLVKAQLIRSLKECASREDEPKSAAAASAYHLALCYVNGFGVEQDPKQAWQWMIKSARLQSLNARAQAYRLHRGLFPEQDLLLETRREMVEWLQQAVRHGSSEAAQDLLGLDPLQYQNANRLWEKRFCQIDSENAYKVVGVEDLTVLCQQLSPIDLDRLILNERGGRPIHLAASMGNIDVLRELVTCGIDINCLNGRGESALLCACRANEPNTALWLMNKGASTIPASSGESPLHWLIAMEGPNLRDIALKLIEKGVELEQQYKEIENNELTFDIYPLGTPLDWAVSKRSLSAVRLLIELGADPFNECSQYSAFTRAASVHDWEILQILLTSQHATPSKVSALESTGHSLLFEAIYCYPRYARILLHGQDIDEAAIKTIEALLEINCDPSSVDKDGSSIMHILAGYCDYDLVKMLLDKFPFEKYINAKAGTLNRTPIHQALAAGNVEVFKLLIEHGADTYVQASGHTILHLLVTIEDEDCAVLFLKALDPISRKDKNILARSEGVSDGLTAFELAVHSSHLKIAELLLDAGFDPAAMKDRDLHFSALLIVLPTWDSVRALQYYLDKVQAPFIVRESTGLSVLHVAASMMHYLGDNLSEEQKFDILLKKFSSDDQINAVTKRSGDSELVAGQTPLHYAAKFGVFHAAQKLLQAGANRIIKDNDGNTALDLARSQLASLGAMVVRHEEFRTITDLRSTVSLLERPQELKISRILQNDNTNDQMRTRFSRLGFQTQPAGQD